MVSDSLAGGTGHPAHGYRTLADRLSDRREDPLIDADRGGPGADYPGGGVACDHGAVRALRSRAWSWSVLAVAAAILILAAVAACGGHP